MAITTAAINLASRNRLPSTLNTRLLRANHCHRVNFRPTMSSTASTAQAPKCDWLVILPDYEGALARRMEVRQKHLAAIQPLANSGFWKMGGAMLEEVPKEGEGLKIVGSTMIAHATSKEEVLEAIKQDIYFKSNVWDLDKIQIYPFKTAFRNP